MTKRPDVLIHVGYPKCGSTWLQNHIFYHYDRGFFPLTDKDKEPGRSEYLFSHFVMDTVRPRSPQSRQILSPFEFNAQHVMALLDTLDWDHDGVPVFSSERLTGMPFSGGFDSRQIADRLKQVFPEGKILIVIREQTSILLSTYFEYLKIGGVHGLEDYLTRSGDVFTAGFALHFFEYHHLIEYYQSLFGKKNVLVLPFELFVREPREFMHRLAAFSHTTIPDNLDFDQVENQGLNRIVEYRTRRLNLLTKRSSLNDYSVLYAPGWNKLINPLKDLAARCIPESANQRFTASLKQRVRHIVQDYYLASNDRTAALTGLDLPAFGYAASPRVESAAEKVGVE